MIWKSELFLYGIMAANLLVVLGALLWSWRAGLLRDQEGAARVLFEEPPSETNLAGERRSGERDG